MSVNNNLDFFVPVTRMPEPGVFINKSLSTKLVELADEFFYYGFTPERAFVSEVRQNDLGVKLIACEAKAWQTALKLTLLFTPIASVMLLIKIIARCSSTFSVISSAQNKEIRKEWETVDLKRNTTAAQNQPNARYDEICKNAGISYQDTSGLQKHVLFFAEQSGKITQSSMQKGFERLGSWKITAFIVSSFLYNGLSKLTNSTNGFIALKDIAKGTHSSDSGVFKKDGTFDPAKFESVQKNKPSVNPNIVTFEDIKRLREANQARDAAKADVKSGAFASNGEFTLTLNLFSDCYVVDTYGNCMPAMNLQRLKRLYTEGPQLFEEVAAAKAN
jgi:peroxygenase